MSDVVVLQRSSRYATEHGLEGIEMPRFVPIIADEVGDNERSAQMIVDALTRQFEGEAAVLAKTQLAHARDDTRHIWADVVRRLDGR